MNLFRYEKYEKSRLKNKVRITNATLLSLLLTGNIAYGTDVDNKNIFNEINRQTGNEMKKVETVEVKKQRIIEDPEKVETLKKDKILTFFNVSKEIDKRHDSSSDTSTPNVRPGIDDSKPLTPNVRPGVDDSKPLTPEQPVEVKPLPPVGILPDRPYPITPLTPEIPATEVIIWKNGEEIYGEKYILTEDFTMNAHFNGMKTRGGMIINEATIYGNNSSYAGMYVEDHDDGREGVGLNKGTIQELSTGMYSKNGGEIINETTGRINNVEIAGMYVEGNGSSAVNKGEISTATFGAWGMYIEGDNSTGINKAGIKGGGSGMKAVDGGTAINEKDGNISNDGNYGMSGSSGTVINDGFISNNGNIGMYGENKSTVMNNGTISNNYDQGMYSRDSTMINSRKGIIKNTRAHGMYASDKSTAVNYGVIMNGSYNGMIAYNYSTVINNGFILNGGAVGMSASQNSVAINNGIILNKGDNRMQATQNNSLAKNMGYLDSGYNSYTVMEARSKGTIVNDSEGTIEIKHNDSQGMRAEDSFSTAENNGKIIFNGTTGIGISAVNGASGINKGEIITSGGTGMYTDAGEIFNNGVVTIGGDSGVGMEANGGIATNKGIIDINGDDGIGILVTNGGSGINDSTGKINLNGNNGIGISVNGAGSSYVNLGEINIASGTSGNQGIVVDGTAVFENSGSIVSDGEFNTNELGGGKFLMSEGGSLEAETIKGNIYASGALALGGYENEYSTYKMLKTNNLEGEIISNSVMFDAHFTENADEYGYYDVVLDRKDFHEIIKNQELADILEDNYVEGGGDLKEDYYDSLKLTGSKSELTSNVESSYGIDTYTTFTKQTYDIINNSKKVITKNVLENEEKLEVGEFRVIGGGDYLEKDNDGYSSISGYDTDMFSIYFGGEKQINKTAKVGVILTVGNADTEYDNNSTRNDDYFQGTGYLKYQTEDNVTFTTMLFAGTTKSDMERKVQFGLISEELTDDIRSNYTGMASILSKRFNVNSGKTYLEPRLEYNMTYIKQDDINESGDYKVKIKGKDSLSIETGVGMALGHRIELDKGSKIDLKASITGYVELADPYENTDSRLTTLSNDKVKIDGYDGNDYYGKIDAGISYTTIKDLTVRTGAAFNLGENQDNVEYSAGIIYQF